MKCAEGGREKERASFVVRNKEQKIDRLSSFMFSRSLGPGKKRETGIEQP